MTEFPERPSLNELFEKHGDFVWRVLARSGVKDADLRDATQEVFIVVSKRLGEWRGEAAITTWLYGIATRVAANFRRRVATRREDFSDEPPQLVAPGDPEQDLEREQARVLLATILDSLPEAQRLIFMLYELEERTCAQIAAELQLPIGTVFTRLRAARAAFEQSARKHARER